jgi:CheY-like chemotaxis protein
VRSVSLLVADDVLEIVEYVEAAARRIRTHDIRVTRTTRAQEALALAGERDFDVVITDLRMPRVDGLRILRAAYERNPAGRRAVLTGYNEIPQDGSPGDAHVDAVATKPLSMDELVDLIHALVTNERLEMTHLREDAARRLRPTTPAQAPPR